MKKLIVVVTLSLITVNAFASDWILPALGGFLAGTILNRQAVAGPMVMPPQVYGPGGYATIPPRTIYHTPGLMQQTYNCLVPVRDPLTGYVRNEVMMCVQ